MIRFPIGVVCCLVLSLAVPVCRSPALFAEVPAEQVVAGERLVPDTTKGYLSIPDPQRLREQFDQTQIGQLMRDEQMRPFADDLKRQFREQLASSDTLGLSWADLDGIPTGEVAMATIRVAADRTATAMLAVVAGNEEEAQALLAKVDADMRGKQARKSNRRVAGVELTVYELPADAGKRRETGVFFLHAGLLAAIDNLTEAEALAARLAGGTQGALADLDSYQAIRRRIDAEADGLEPEMRWFLEPFGYVKALRVRSDDGEKRGRDMLRTLQNQGFDAVRAVGGNVNFYHDGHDILHRTFVYAPAVEPEPGQSTSDKYRLAARMLKFENTERHDPPAWVPRELAGYISFNLDILNAFESAETLVNEMAGAEVFGDVIEGMEKDPNGPQINIREELLAHLENRVVVVTDNVVPITPESERMLIGAALTDTPAMAAGLEKLMTGDPSVRRRTHRQHVIWEVVEEEAALPEVNIEGFGFDPLEDFEEEAVQETKLFPHASLAVVDGWILIGSHLDILKRMLDTLDLEEPTLAEAVDYRLIVREADKMGAGNNAFRAFSRTDEEYRGTYELLRAGQMPKSQSLLGKLLNQAFTDEGEEGAERRQKLDAGKLPPFQVTQRYLGPAGLWVTSEEEGWIVTGILLPKQLPVANLDPAP